MINEFIAHLARRVTPPVAYAYTANPVEDASTSLPAIFVYPGDSVAEPSTTDNQVRQRLTEEVVCLLGCLIADYERLRAELRQAALGWTYTPYDAFELSGGETLVLRSSVIWIRETYTTQRLITQSL